MNYEAELQKAAAFLEPARAAIDNAELAIAFASGHERAGAKLVQAMNGLDVATKNLYWCSRAILAIATRMDAETKSATPIVGPTAG